MCSRESVELFLHNIISKCARVVVICRDKSITQSSCVLYRCLLHVGIESNTGANCKYNYKKNENSLNVNKLYLVRTREWGKATSYRKSKGFHHQSNKIWVWRWRLSTSTRYSSPVNARYRIFLLISRSDCLVAGWLLRLKVNIDNLEVEKVF